MKLKGILFLLTSLYAINLAYSSDDKLNDKVISQLKLDHNSIMNELVTSEVLPYDTTCRVFVVPFATSKEDEESWEGRIYLIKVSTIDTLIKSVSLLKDTISSDAVSLNEIVVDTTYYLKNKGKKVFSIRLKYSNNSFAAGYSYEDFLLISESDHIFTSILNTISYERYYYGSYSCKSEELEQNSTFSISNDLFSNIVENVHVKYEIVRPNGSIVKSKKKEYINVFRFVNGSFVCKNRKSANLDNERNSN